jgi:chorismate mutase
MVGRGVYKWDHYRRGPSGRVAAVVGAVYPTLHGEGKLLSAVEVQICSFVGEGPSMVCRGVRGATTVESNSREAILEEARKLLALMIRFNDIRSEDVASAIFTLTRDLDAEFPALAARQIGWGDVPLLCSYELSVPGSLPKCIRILVHWNTEKTQQQITHVYLGSAQKLRPDLAELPPVDLAELEAWIAEHISTGR